MDELTVYRQLTETQTYGAISNIKSPSRLDAEAHDSDLVLSLRREFMSMKSNPARDRTKGAKSRHCAKAKAKL